VSLAGARGERFVRGEGFVVGLVGFGVRAERIAGEPHAHEVLREERFGVLHVGRDVRVHRAHDGLDLLAVPRAQNRVILLVDFPDRLFVVEVLQRAEEHGLARGERVGWGGEGGLFEIARERSVAGEGAQAGPEERDRAEDDASREHEEARARARHGGDHEGGHHGPHRDAERGPPREAALVVGDGARVLGRGRRGRGGLRRGLLFGARLPLGALRVRRHRDP